MQCSRNEVKLKDVAKDVDENQIKQEREQHSSAGLKRNSSKAQPFEGLVAVKHDGIRRKEMLSEEQCRRYGMMLRHTGDGFNQRLQREQGKGSNELFYWILLFALFIWLIFLIKNFLD